jgi:hypothetical protein
MESCEVRHCRDISFEETEVANLMLNNRKVGDLEDITEELLEWETLGIYKASKKCLTWSGSKEFPCSKVTRYL